MALNIKRTKVDVNLSNYSMRIMGPSGSGKTTLMAAIIAEIEKRENKENLGVFLATEAGYKHISDLPIINPVDKRTGLEKDYHDCYADINNTVNMLVKEKQSDPANFPVKFVIFDTTTNMEDQITKKLESDHGGTINEILKGFGRGQRLVRETMKDTMEKLRKNAITPWYISHTRIKGQVDKLTDAETVIIGADGNEQFDGVLLKDLDLSMMIVKDNIVAGKRVQETVRKLRFREDGLHKACKSRFENIPEEVILGDDVKANAIMVVDIIQEAIRKQTTMDKEEFKEAVKAQKKEDAIKEIDIVASAVINEEQEKLDRLKAGVVSCITTESAIDINFGAQWMTWFNEGGIDVIAKGDVDVINKIKASLETGGINVNKYLV